MAWFKCSLGSNGGATLTVTCSEDFAGLVITCTNGSKTFTKTCPLSSPYEVVFDIPESDTWTVSGEISGVQYSTVVEVSLEYTAELETGFNWEAWVTLGGLDPTSYSDLAGVLADEAAVRTLFTKKASVDYFATKVAQDPTTFNDFSSSTYVMKWIGLRVYATTLLTAISSIASTITSNATYTTYHNYTTSYDSVQANIENRLYVYDFGVELPGCSQYKTNNNVTITKSSDHIDITIPSNTDGEIYFANSIDFSQYQSAKGIGYGSGATIMAVRDTAPRTYTPPSSDIAALSYGTTLSLISLSLTSVTSTLYFMPFLISSGASRNGRFFAGWLE